MTDTEEDTVTDFSRDKHLPALAAAILSGPERVFAYELAQTSGVRSPTVYILLHRLVTAGWLSDGWETPQEARNPRYPRRYYVATGEGREMLGSVTAVTLGEVDRLRRIFTEPRHEVSCPQCGATIRARMADK